MSTRVIIVDDSILVRGMIKALITTWEDYEVVGEAGNGKKGVEAVLSLKPDLVIMDVNMPEMDGIEATEMIMKLCPTSIVVFTSEDIGEVGYRAINKGALEVIPKPDISKINDNEFIGGFKTMLDHSVKYGLLKQKQRNQSEKSSGLSRREKPVKKFSIVVIGASTGGPSSVKTVLSGLSHDFPLPIMISQHIEIGFDQGYANWLDQDTPLNVKLVNSPIKLEAGTVYVAPATHHLICRNGMAIPNDGPRVGNQKPSVDKMFISAINSYGSSVLGVLLTGMGRDGAAGCKSIVSKGGITIVQNKETSMIFGMPKAAIEENGASEVVALQDISKSINEWVVR